MQLSKFFFNQPEIKMTRVQKYANEHVLTQPLDKDN